MGYAAHTLIETRSAVAPPTTTSKKTQMWLDFLHKAVGGLQPDAAADFTDLKRMIKELIGHMHVRRTGGREGIAEVPDEDLIAGLTALHVELKSAADSARIRDRAGFDAACKPVFAHIDTVLAAPGALAGSEAFETDLYALRGHLVSRERRSRSRMKWFRGAALLVSAGPVAGLTIHWGITNYYAIALVESVDVFYPEQRFMRDPDGYYRADYAAMTDTIGAFEDYYFHATRNQPPPPTNQASSSLRGIVLRAPSANREIPLPTVYDKKTATDWGVPPGDESENLFVYRVFLKNLKEANLVSKVGVSVKRSDDSRFFWDRLDVSTELELYPQRNHFTLRTTRAPVKDVAFALAPVRIFDADVTPAVDNGGQIVTSKDFYPKFGAHPVFETRELPVYYRFPRVEAVPEEAARRAAQPRLPTIKDSDQGSLYRALDIITDAIDSQPLVRVDCRDGTTLLVATDIQALEIAARVARVEALSVSIDYALLNGRRQTRQETLQFATPLLFVDQEYRTNRDAVSGCIAAPGLRVQDSVVDTAAAAEVGGNVIEAAVVLAGILNPDLSLSDGAIVIETTFHLDMSEATDLKQFQRELAVMKVGDFAALNIVLTNYSSGIYDFRFFFNDEPVSALRMDPLWPQSLRYKPEDAPLFAGH